MPLNRSYVNPISYGADPTGKKDSTKALQQAINDAGTGSRGTITLDEGTYLYTSLTMPYGGLSLIGSGAGSTVLQTMAGSEGVTSLLVGDGVNTCADVHIADIQFTSTNQKTANAGLKLQKCFRVHLERVRMQNQYRAIYIYNSTETWIDDTDIRDTSENGIVFESTVGNGFDCYLNSVTADNPVVSNNGNGLYWLGGENLVVQNCDFLHYTTNLNIAPPTGQQCRWGFFVDSEFDTGGDNCFKIAPVGGDVVGLTFTNAWAGTAANYGILIDASGGAGLLQGIRFVGLKATHNGLAGIRLVGSVKDVHVSASDIFSNSQTTANSRSGVEIAGGQDITIVDCNFKNGYQQGSTQNYGINFDNGTWTNVIIADCDLTGNTAGGINLNSSTFSGGHIQGNLGHNPVGSVTAPTFPATTVAVTNTTGYDVTAYITNGTSAITQQQLAGASGSFVNTNLQIAASGWGTIRIPANAQYKPTYAGGTPTWTWFAD